MPTTPRRHDATRWRTHLARAALAALVMTAVVGLHGSAASAATATVGDGLTTTDLSAPGSSPASLASALVGPGVSVSNVTYSGAPAQAGLIHLVDPAVVSFNDGVILSSGNIADVVGPNKSDGITGDMAGPDDADLNALITDSQTVYPMTFDAASLEFDFVPTASQVYFTYTFGSDEYLEWVNLFNDVFAFYVNGQNCATVPSGDPVSIDTINDAVNPDLFRDNSSSSPPANPINIESDGLSVEMICSATVNPGVTNHMKLAIADTSDQILDSVVMIKAHSLSTTPPESCNDSVDNDDDLLVDGSDDDCASTTTPPPTGSEGIGSGGSAPPFTGNEGTPIPLDASALGWTAAPETLTTAWTVTGINGTTGSCEITPSAPQPVGPNGEIAVVSAICPDEGEYVASVNGTDAEGSSSFDDDVDFFVHNAPPSVDIITPAGPGPVTFETGATTSLEAQVSDPGAGDSITCTISWGDGTTEEVTPVDGTCSASHEYLTELTGGVLSVTATDDAGDSGASALLFGTTTTIPTDTVVTSAANPSVTGQPVSLTATTILGSTGTMAFYDGTTLLGTRNVAGGTATLTTSALAVGDHGVTAVYKRKSTSAPSVSAELVQRVDSAPTTTTVTSSVNPSVSGQAIKLRATIAVGAPGGGVPTGSVEIYDGSTLLATRSVSGGVASLTVRPTVGPHSYTAVYSGSPSHLGSTSPEPLDQQVDPASTTTTLTTASGPSVFGQSIVLKAVAKAVAPGAGPVPGTVTLYDGTAVVGSASLANGVATWTVRPAVGPHAYVAVYGGSASHEPSTSTELAHLTVVAGTAVRLVSQYPTAPLGRTGYVLAYVSVVAPGSGAPTGTVRFYSGGILVHEAPLVSGRARMPIAALPRGVHELTAVYEGDASFGASWSPTPLTQTIT